MNYSIEPVPIAAIDRGDTTFQISTGRDFSDLEASIASIGLLIPPTLKRVNARFVIVNGFRRIAACVSLKMKVIDANILQDACTDRECVQMAVAENALQRPLNLIEKSRAVTLLSFHFSNPADLSAASRAAGLFENPAMVRKLLPLARLSRNIQDAILDGTLSLAIADELGRFDPETRERLATLFTVLKMSLNKQREVLGMLEEISLREGLSLAGLLSEAPIVSILTDTESDRNVKTGQLRAFLKKRRYPAIHAAAEKASTLIKALALTDEVKLVLPRDLESSEFSMTLRFSSSADLKRLGHDLVALSERSELKTLLSKEL